MYDACSGLQTYFKQLKYPKLIINNVLNENFYHFFFVLHKMSF